MNAEIACPISPAIAEPEPLDAEVLQLVYEVADILRIDGGEPEPRASLLAQTVVQGLRHRVGGASIYVLAPSRAKRNAGIRQMFNGSNLKEVCREFDVGKTTVYRIAGLRGKR